MVKRTYQRSKLKRARSIGFTARNKGKKSVVSRRRQKGRWYLIKSGH